MGIVYEPKKKMKQFCPTQYDDGGWDLNSAGADLLGITHFKLGLPNDDKTGVWEGWYRAPYSMKKATALDTAKKLAKKTDEEILAVLEDKGAACCWGGTPQEFLEWIRDWQKFLELCGGYKTEG